MNSPHFFFFSFIFIISLSAIAGSVSAYDINDVTDPTITTNGAFSDAWDEGIKTFNDVKDALTDKSEEIFGGVDDTIGTLQDIPGAVWNYFILKILGVFSTIAGVLAGLSAWYDTLWEKIASPHIGYELTIGYTSFQLIKAVATALIFMFVIRLWAFIMSMLP